MRDTHDGPPGGDASSPGHRDGRRAGVPADARAGAGSGATAVGADREGSTDSAPGPPARAASRGRVYLVGAGPGDPELLTRRAWDLLASADAVLHDSLTPDRLLAALPGDGEVVDVGKRPPDPVSQDEIHARLTERATSGQRVVRLKGGDPGVFGRGGEEAEHLAGEDIPFEVVPGVSSVQAAPAMAAIPLTHRDHASSLTVVTGHETPDKADSALDWGAIADTVRAGGTLVVLMGVARLADYVGHLREAGVPGETPVALVQRATWADERTVTSTLACVVEDASTVEPPAVTVVGDVVGVRDRVEAALSRE